jgi:glycosyltransferase involved in cell wall biosynthesis
LDLVEDNVNGLRFPAGDAIALQRAMQVFTENPDLARTWGDASRHKARELTPETGAEKWARVFDALSDQS